MIRKMAIAGLIVVIALWPFSYFIVSGVSFPLPINHFASVDLHYGRVYASATTRMYWHQTDVSITTTRDISQRIEQTRSVGIAMDYPGKMFELKRINFTLPNGAEWRGYSLTLGWWTVVGASALVFAAYVRSQRKPAHLCNACGYDLSGARHEQCPECGSA